MLSIDSGKIAIKGIKLELMMDFSNLVHELYTEKIIEKDELEECFRIALLDEKELKEEKEKTIKSIKEHLDFPSKIDDLLEKLKEKFDK